jgi:crotonobetainyl-CoA:carnitine CoA-transferase CaiB-like acyl-CoA transferase
MGPLDGVRVVERGVWVAGPGAAGILAHWGADVIVENPMLNGTTLRLDGGTRFSPK